VGLIGPSSGKYYGPPTLIALSCVDSDSKGFIDASLEKLGRILWSDVGDRSPSMTVYCISILCLASG